ncbi:hypothetical protein [Cellulomonas sp. Marseille-Q8402]
MDPAPAPPRLPDGRDLAAVVATCEVRARGRRADVRAGYVRAARGVHAVAGADLEDPDIRIAVAATGAPAAVTLGGWAAARLHEKHVLAHRARERRRQHPGRRVTEELPSFDGAPASGRGPVLLPVLLLAPPEVRVTARHGQRLLRSAVLPGERTQVAGLPVTTPLRTAFDLARTVDVEDAVVGLDRLRALGLLDASELDELLRERRGWKGVRAARRALAVSADGVESPQESRMRLLWLAAGLPTPRCNAVVLDGDGRFVARVDLLDEGSGLVGEYDGAVHAAADRRSADADRQERLHALGLEVIRATSVDLATPTSRARWQARLRTARTRVLPGGPGSGWQLAAPV